MEKHAPQASDLYRCQDGTLYLIVAVWEEKRQVEYLDMEEEQTASMGFDLMERDEFIANVLALPDLVRACHALLKACDQLMPGIGNIACQDYAIINEAPILGHKALKLAGKE